MCVYVVHAEILSHFMGGAKLMCSIWVPFIILFCKCDTLLSIYVDSGHADASSIVSEL